MDDDALRLFELLDDLERQAEAAYAEERVWEIADLARAEYARVSLDGRLMASLGGDLVVEVVGVGRVAGRLSRMGRGWLVISGSATWLVLLPAVVSVLGASDRSRHEDAWGLRHRLEVRLVLERLAEQGSRCLLHLRGGGSLLGTVTRIGADFVEVRCEQPGQVALVSLAHLSALQLEATAELA